MGTDLAIFISPTSALEAEHRLIALRFDIRRIGQQIAARRRDPEAATDPDVRDWEHRARVAITYKQAERDQIRLWLRHNRDDDAAGGAADLLEGCYRLLDALARRRVWSPEPEQQTIIEATAGYLRVLGRLP